LAQHQRLELKEGQTTVIQVRVKLRFRVSLLAQADSGSWLAQLKSPPVDGKANEELLALVARHFGCRKSAVSIKSGASARTKLVQIEGANQPVQNVA
jgi:uncharacterized protein (TIGR00251 family)